MYTRWLESHQPFHWFAEFYEIIHDKGGFDVVIGNPPYVEYTKVKKDYVLKNYSTESCGNLYAFVSERAINICNRDSYISFIIPSASVCTPRMNNLLKTVQNRFSNVWLSIWDERPSKLFDGVDQQLSIHIYNQGFKTDSQIFITNMIHWKSSFREFIFSNLKYQNISKVKRLAEVYPKIQSNLENEILLKISVGVTSFDLLSNNRNDCIYYRNAGGRYWRLVKSFPSFFNSSRDRSTSSTEKILNVNSDYKFLLVAIYSSSLFYWYWRIVSNCRHLTDREFEAFGIPHFSFKNEVIKSSLEKLAKRFEHDLNVNKERIIIENKSSGTIEQDLFYLNKSKPIIDEIDTVLAKHYGFTDEELDFIINYDIKYRMGKELLGEEESGVDEEED